MSTVARDAKVRALTMWNRHRTLIVSGVATVAVLAAVILGVAAFGPTNSSSTGVPPQPVLTATAESDRLLQDAQKAAAAGDNAKAADLANQALAKNPNNSAAKTLIEKLASSANSEASGSNGNSNSDAGSGSDGSSGSNQGSNGQTFDDSAFGKAAATTRQWLPATFSGFAMGASSEDEGGSTVSAIPAGGSAGGTVLWAVHDRKDKAGAKRFVEKTSKQLYPKDAVSLNIDGTPAYFGTDGTRFATVVFVRGRYAFEVIASGSGMAPKDLKSLAQKAAAAFSDAPPK